MRISKENEKADTVHTLDSTDKKMNILSNILFGIVPEDTQSIFKELEIPYDDYQYSIISFHIENFTDYIHTWKRDSASFYREINNFIPFETSDAYFSLVRYSFGNLDIMIIYI